MGLADYSALLLGGLPKQGQTLEEVKDLLLSEIKKLRAGEFDEKMLEANINNFKPMRRFRHPDLTPLLQQVA